MNFESARPASCYGIYALLLLVSIILLTVAVTTWSAQRQQYHELISEARHEIDRIAALVERRPLLEKQLSELDEHLGIVGYFLKAATDAAATVELIDHLKMTLPGRGSQILGIEPLPLHAIGNLARVGVRVHLRGDEKILLHLLHRHEKERPLLFVDNVRIRALERRHRVLEREDEHTLDIHFDLIGYLDKA